MFSSGSATRELAQSHLDVSCLCRISELKWLVADNLLTKNLNLTSLVNFTGVIVEKLPNTEFVVRLTHLPDGSQVEASKILVNGKITGKIRDRKIKVAVHDVVTISISMESAKSMSGFIIYRERSRPK
jgi:translation initiation factor IF-1